MGGDRVGKARQDRVGMGWFGWGKPSGRAKPGQARPSQGRAGVGGAGLDKTIQVK